MYVREVRECAEDRRKVERSQDRKVTRSHRIPDGKKQNRSHARRERGVKCTFFPFYEVLRIFFSFYFPVFPFSIFRFPQIVRFIAPHFLFFKQAESFPISVFFLFSIATQIGAQPHTLTLLCRSRLLPSSFPFSSRHTCNDAYWTTRARGAPVPVEERHARWEDGHCHGWQRRDRCCDHNCSGEKGASVCRLLCRFLFWPGSTGGAMCVWPAFCGGLLYVCFGQAIVRLR